MHTREVFDVQGYALVNCLVVTIQRSFDSWIALFDRFSYLLLSFLKIHDCLSAHVCVCLF